MKKPTKDQKKIEVLDGLKEALSIVNTGYPWHGAPKAIKLSSFLRKTNDATRN